MEKKTKFSMRFTIVLLKDKNESDISTISLDTNIMNVIIGQMELTGFAKASFSQLKLMCLLKCIILSELFQ